MSRRGVTALLVLVVAASSCAREQQRPPAQQGGYGYGQPGGYYGGPQGAYPPPAQPGQPQQYPPQQVPPGQTLPPTVPPPSAPPGAPPAGTPPPPVSSLPPPPIGSFDASGAMTDAFMSQQATTVLQELVGALAEADRQRVQGIPLAVIQDPKEVNAFAGCDKTGRAFMGITMPLLRLEAAASEARAFDELQGTQKYDQYIGQVAEMVRTEQPVRGLPPGTLPLPQALDPRKLARQKFLFDSQVAFVLGHELAHHYRGHTGCAGQGTSTNITTEDVGRLLSNAVPIFNQPLEIEADVQGMRNVLTTGSRRSGGAWSEEGALMVLGFFNRLSGFGPDVLLLGFLQTHPHPTFRIPVVQGAANQWRSGGGTNPFPFPFPIPGLGG